MRFLFATSMLLFSSVMLHAQTVVINEFVAKNDSVGGYQEPDGGYGDWIELHNLSSAAVDLSGYNLSDDNNELDKWEFPSGTTISANGYLIVWADNDEDQTGIHTSFKLAGDGEEIVLSNGGTVLDQVTFGVQNDNISEARIPNGTGDFTFRTPTPAANNGTSSTRDFGSLALNTYPSPAKDVVFVELGEARLSHYAIFDVVGKQVAEGQIELATEKLNIDVAGLTKGLHVISFDNGRASAIFTKE